MADIMSMGEREFAYHYMFRLVVLIILFTVATLVLTKFITVIFKT